MYYYILESTGRKFDQWHEKIKDVLGDLGIAGETVSPSSARTIEELTSLGIMKGYSTIVAVGSEKIVNKVATAIIDQKEDKDVVLGVIPEDYNSMIAHMVGITDLRDACNALKQRKLEQFDACFIEPNKYFLNEAVIENDRAFDVYLALEEIKAGLVSNKITIKPGLAISIEDNSMTNEKRSFLDTLFKKKQETKNIYSSFFHPLAVRIETVDKNIPVKVDSEVIAKTPIFCETRPKALKIIVKRDMIIPKE